MELVVHFGEVLLHLVELHAFHVDPRVLLTVCNAGLQAHVQVGVRDGGGGSAHGLEGHVDGFHAVGAHLQALQVCRSLDRVLGVVFAPVPRDYSFKMNKKEKRAALKSALTSRVEENKFIVVDEMKFDEIKTKKFQTVLNNLNVNKALVVLEEGDKNAEISAKNIPDVKTARVNTINVYDILKYNTVIATKAVVAAIEEVYA